MRGVGAALSTTPSERARRARRVCRFSPWCRSHLTSAGRVSAPAVAPMASPQCVPSRTTMFAGRRIDQVRSVRGQPQLPPLCVGREPHAHLHPVASRFGACRAKSTAKPTREACRVSQRSPRLGRHLGEVGEGEGSLQAWRHCGAQAAVARLLRLESHRARGREGAPSRRWLALLLQHTE